MEMFVQQAHLRGYSRHRGVWDTPTGKRIYIGSRGGIQLRVYNKSVDCPGREFMRHLWEERVKYDPAKLVTRVEFALRSAKMVRQKVGTDDALEVVRLAGALWRRLTTSWCWHGTGRKATLWWTDCVVPAFRGEGTVLPELGERIKEDEQEARLDNLVACAARWLAVETGRSAEDVRAGINAPFRRLMSAMAEQIAVRSVASDRE